MSANSCLLPDSVMAGEERSIVEYFAEHERYRCGYCGNSDTNFSHGMWAHSMTVQDYEDLLNRGWRRSGKYTYKPTMNMTCCPQYTIRCEVLNFKMRKSHKKIIKKVNRYLIHGIKPEKDKDDDEIDGNQPKTEGVESENQSTGGSQSTNQSTDLKNNNQSEMSTEASGVQGETDTKKDKNPKPGVGADPNKPRCKKKKELRKEKKQAKAGSKGEASPDQQSSPRGSKDAPEAKTLEDFLSEPDKAENCAHKLEIRLVRSYPQSGEFKDSLQESHTVYHSYQMAIHKDPPNKPNMKQYTRFLVDSPLEVRLIRTHPEADEFRYSYQESYNVFRQYQMTIHKETEGEVSKHGYSEFLVKSPLEAKHEEGGLPMGYGSFHQQYILDGKIICVGVIDILPSLVSSKYLYYDPEYGFLNLGTYSALREIAFVQSLHKYSEKMIYYYMGFYLQNCPKMKYKGQYFPSFLLCPETYTWHPVEKCSPLLDQKLYMRFADDGVEDEDGKIDVNRVLVLHAQQAMPYEVYKAIKAMVRPGNDDEEEVKEYAQMAGKTCAYRMLLFRK